MIDPGNIALTREYDVALLEKRCNKTYNQFLKRIIDFIMAIILSILLLPLFAILSLAILLDSGFPILYKAERGGYQNRPFKIYKFRTMVPNADQIGGGTTALNDPRITKIGKFLRQTKLDEIPQLFNILKGEMSFIGPRPELLRYTNQYNPIEKYILQVRPGITDYSSVEFIDLDKVVGGENADEMYERYVLRRKNALRLKYVSNISFRVDCYLFFYTIIKTVRKALLVILIKEK